MRMALIMAATAAYAQDDIFGCSSPRLDAPSGNIPSDKQKCQPKEQHEFTIKGVKIMAASKRDAIKPIPLTPEILKKNGWVKDTHRHCLDEMPAEAYEKKNFPLTHFNVTFGKKRIQASHDCLFVRNLKYVSDLQHLLFGLELNSEMEV